MKETKARLQTQEDSRQEKAIEKTREDCGQEKIIYYRQDKKDAVYMTRQDNRISKTKQ